MKITSHRFIVVVLLSIAVGTAFAGTLPKFQNPGGANQVSVKTGAANGGNGGFIQDASSAMRSQKGSGSMMCSVNEQRQSASESVSAPSNPLGHIRECRMSESELSITLPPVSVELFGDTYSVGDGSELQIPVKIVPSSELGEGCRAEWHTDAGAIYISEDDYSKYNKETQNGIKGDKKWLEEFGKILQHEAVHSQVDKEYLKRFVDENGNRVGELDDFYHFMSEMLAYVGGDGMSVKNAAHSIASACAHEITWKHKRVGRCDKYVYSEGVRNIVNKFLKGEPYTPPKVRSKKDDKGNNVKQVSIDDLKNMDLDDKNGDWCQCNLPGCEERVSEEGFFVSFVCLKCNKVNVSFAKKAIALEAKAKELGGDVKWFGPNAEQRAKAAAGNAK